MTHLCVSCTWRRLELTFKLRLAIFRSIGGERWAVEVPLQDCVVVGILNFLIDNRLTDGVTQCLSFVISSATSKRFRSLNSFQINLLLVDYAGLRGSLQLLGSELNSYQPTNTQHITYLFNTLSVSNLPARGVLPSTRFHSIEVISILLLLLGAHIIVDGTSNLGLGQDTLIGKIS